jgi:hypothetical protein
MAEQALDLARADLLLHTDGIPAALVTACSSYYASAATCVAKATSLAVACAKTVSDTYNSLQLFGVAIDSKINYRKPPMMEDAIRWTLKSCMLQSVETRSRALLSSPSVT